MTNDRKTEVGDQKSEPQKSEPQRAEGSESSKLKAHSSKERQKAKGVRERVGGWRQREIIADFGLRIADLKARSQEPGARTQKEKT